VISTRIDRAYAVLRALGDGQDPGASFAEVGELVAGHHVYETSNEERAPLAAAAGQIETLRTEVVTLRRAEDLASGPKSATRGGAPTGKAAEAAARARLRAATDQLESASLAGATLAAMVPNRATGTFLTLSLDGRQTLRALAVWGSRAPTLDLDGFLRGVAYLRNATASAVRTAVEISGSLSGEDDGMPVGGASPPAVHASALLLALRGQAEAHELDDRLRVNYAMRHISGREARSDDRLLAGAILSTLDGPVDTISQGFRSVHDGLVAIPALASAPRPEVDLLAAGLTETALGGARDAVIARAAEFAARLAPIGPLGLLAPTLSALDPEEVVRRFSAALDAFGALGYPIDPVVRSAAGLLAGTQVAPGAVAGRLAALDPTMRGLFPAPAVADALLAALPLSGPEALLLYDYSVAAISQATYFNETLEIDYQALLLTGGLGALGAVAAAFGGDPPVPGSGPIPSAASPLPTGPGGDPPLASGGAGPAAIGGLAGGALVRVLFLGQDAWLLRDYETYVREHPLHANIVPIYG